jgi:hypothetical protein
VSDKSIKKGEIENKKRDRKKGKTAFYPSIRHGEKSSRRRLAFSVMPETSTACFHASLFKKAFGWGRTGSPKGSPHFCSMGILLCATPCRIFHLHGCRCALLGVFRGEAE